MRFADEISNDQYDLIDCIFALANKLQMMGDRMIKGLSTKQWLLLKRVSQMQPGILPTITQIAANMNTSRQNIAKMMSDLAEDGYVFIETSPDDARSKKVRLAPKGIDVLEDLSPAAESLVKGVFADITKERSEQAKLTLYSMLYNLQDMEIDMR
jgi:DNA-binding MarR family transcriptional regulator